MERSGSLASLVACNSPGWQVETRKGGVRVCFVRPDANGTTYGWVLP